MRTCDVWTRPFWQIQLGPTEAFEAKDEHLIAQSGEPGHIRMNPAVQDKTSREKIKPMEHFFLKYFALQSIHRSIVILRETFVYVYEALQNEYVCNQNV